MRRSYVFGAIFSQKGKGWRTRYLILYGNFIDLSITSLRAL